MVASTMETNCGEAGGAGAGDKRAVMYSGHIVDVSVTHGSGTLELDDGRRIEFVVADSEDADAKRLHVGDHAWVTVDQAEVDARMLLCPTRNRMLRVRLAG